MLPEWNPAELNDLLADAGMPAVVCFWIPENPSATLLAPVLEALAAEFPGQVAFAQVNAAHAAEILHNLHIPGVPAVVVFDGTTPVDQRLGLAPLRVYREMVERALLAYTV